MAHLGPCEKTMHESTYLHVPIYDSSVCNFRGDQLRAPAKQMRVESQRSWPPHFRRWDAKLNRGTCLLERTSFNFKGNILIYTIWSRPMVLPCLSWWVETTIFNMKTFNRRPFIGIVKFLVKQVTWPVCCWWLVNWSKPLVHKKWLAQEMSSAV